MRIAFITTVRHNVGDDFVRDGLKYLLKKALTGHALCFESVHKHAPITARVGFGRMRKAKSGRALDERLPLTLTRDRIVSADLVVQSGAPVYWCHQAVNAHCCDNEWYNPLVRRRLAGTNKLLNIAGGSCQAYQSDGSEVCPRCRDYVREFYAACRVTTLRDAVAKRILNDAGHDAPVIPCTSLFAVDEHSIQSAGEDYVAVNFMPKAAHYTFGQAIDQQKWLTEFSRFYFELKRSERVVFSCHDRSERDWARRIDPRGEMFFAAPNSVRYLEFYARAKAGVVNRIHAALALASLGKPALAIGGDSRARMAAEIGLPTLFVNDADTAALLNGYDSLLRMKASFSERMKDIKQQALGEYVKLLR